MKGGYRKSPYSIPRTIQKRRLQASPALAYRIKLGFPHRFIRLGRHVEPVERVLDCVYVDTVLHKGHLTLLERTCIIEAGGRAACASVLRRNDVLVYPT